MNSFLTLKITNSYYNSYMFSCLVCIGFEFSIKIIDYIIFKFAPIKWHRRYVEHNPTMVTNQLSHYQVFFKCNKSIHICGCGAIFIRIYK